MHEALNYLLDGTVSIASNNGKHEGTPPAQATVCGSNNGRHEGAKCTLYVERLVRQDMGLERRRQKRTVEPIMAS